ncbi:unnamed protein product, partial [Rotaria socialis]
DAAVDYLVRDYDLVDRDGDGNDLADGSGFLSLDSGGAFFVPK